MEQQVPNLGETPPENAGRDAIHVAVISVIAGEELQPNDRVTRLSDGKFYKTLRSQAIGFVDPILENPALTGERFWLCLFPNTITSLRHVWTHPAFKVSLTNESKTSIP